MRRKIQELIRGEFEYDRPALLFEKEELCFSVIEKEDYGSAFRMRSSSGKLIRGIVTCENPNIRVDTPEFSGVSMEIHFTYFGSKVTEGDEEHGCFVVTSSSGEYLFPYHATITRRYLSTSIGKIKTLNDFVNLANLNWDEAQKVFASSHFPNIFHENAEFRSMLYKGLTQRSCGNHEMEEFLIGVGKKKRSRFSLDAKELTFPAGERPTARPLAVNKSEWGYIHIRISSDAPFVSLPKNDLYSYDFIGKHTEIPIRVIPELMHDGKNYARLTFANCFQRETVLITAHKGATYKERSLAGQRRRLDARLVRLYLAFRMGGMIGEDWKNEMLGLLLEAETVSPGDKWLLLYQAFVYATAGEMGNADSLLSSAPRGIRGARTPLGAFYQYIVCLKNGDFTDDFLARTREIHQKYRHDPVVNWILIQTDPSLHNPGRKYQAIRRFLTEESRNPIFYLEGALLLREHPELLGSRDAFDFCMAGWLSKHDLLTKELSVRIQNLSQGRNLFSRNYMRVLSKCYKRFGDENIVRTACVYLIHTGRYGEAYFPWFRRGVEQKLKIAGLYEAFLLSWSRSQGELPREIVRYFSMNSSLPAGKKAMLYAYIVRNRRRLEKDWASYMVIVKNFALKELEKGHISDDLAIIYDELRRKMDADEWMAVRHDADFFYKIHTTGENVAAVRVQSGLQEARVPLVGGQAFICLYQRPFVILYEDASGNLYTTRDCCRISKTIPGNNIYNARPEKPSAKKEIGQTSGRENAVRLERMEGSIDEMEELLLTLPAHAKGRIRYAQQLMIRMLFTGHLGKRHGEVFGMLLGDVESESLLTAYVTLLSRRFLTKEQLLSGAVYAFLGERLHGKKTLNVWCETAFLKSYLMRTGTESADPYKKEAYMILQKNLFAGNYFDFYRLLPAEETRKWLLMGLKVVTAFDKPEKIFYMVFPESREMMREVLPGVYTYPLRLFAGETLSYTITDADGNVETSGRLAGEQEDLTRAGRLAALGDQPDAKEQYAYAELCDMAEQLFTPIKE